jgi:hypothetical protein
MNVRHTLGSPWTWLGIVFSVGIFAGCLEKPPIEERWSNVRIDSQSVGDTTPLSPGDSTRVRVKTSVRFEDLITGFVVAELRASQSLSYEDIGFDSIEDPIVESELVEQIISQSIPAGRATRATVGFPQLIRRFDFDFDVRIPTIVAGSYDPPGGNTQSLFLVVYLAEGDEVRLATGQDSLVVDPFLTQDMQVLHKGLAIPLNP